MIRYFFLLALGILSSFASSSQDWKKIGPSSKRTDTLAIYRWSSANKFHYIYGEITLLKSGNFVYNSDGDLFAVHEYCEGKYTFKRDTLILNSEFQPDSLPVRISYSDADRLDSLISFAFNIDSVPLWNAVYRLNNDTSFNSSYMAGFPLSHYPANMLTNIKSLKIEVSPGVTSAWIPIDTTRKFIHVTVLSKRDFNEYQPRVLTNYKFLRKGSRLVDITDQR